MKISCKSKGNFNNVLKSFKKIASKLKTLNLDDFGKEGVEKLQLATPIDSKKTSECWGYSVEKDKRSERLIFTNTNLDSQGTPIVILIQYGHVTRNGGYVMPNDFVTPVIDELILELNKKLKDILN